MTQEGNKDTKLAFHGLAELANAALAVGDGWMADKMNALLKRGRLLVQDFAAAVGAFCRLLEPDAASTKVMLADVLKGSTSAPNVPALAAAASFDDDELHHAEHVVMAMVESMAQATDDDDFGCDPEAWTRLALERERAEQLLTVLRLRGRGWNAGAVVRVFDEEVLEKFDGFLPSSEDLAEDEELRRAGLIDPEAWWLGGKGMGAF